LNEKAIAIAKDVLAHLGMLKPQQGTFLSGTVTQRPGLTGDTQLQELLDEVQEGCRVCALGACLLSYVRLHDHVTLGETASNWGPHFWAFGAGRRVVFSHLTNIFDRLQLQLIESAFEEVPMCDSTEKSQAHYDAAHFGAVLSQTTDPGLSLEERRAKVLAAIMNNIIANDGHFVPKLQPEGAQA